jgi:PAS domain S-box-containing protein
VPTTAADSPAVTPSPRAEERSPLSALSHEIVGALEEINVPSYVIDPTGIVRWVNDAGRRLVGEVRGRQFTSVIVREDARRSREIFVRKILGTTRVTDDKVEIWNADGQAVTAEFSSVPLREGHRIVGVFGQISRYERIPSPRPHHPRLTPRQTEVLHLLERGLSTDQIASELQIARETVRNHIRHLMRSLGVNSRLQAVAAARAPHGSTAA